MYVAIQYERYDKVIQNTTHYYSQNAELHVLEDSVADSETTDCGSELFHAWCNKSYDECFRRIRYSLVIVICNM